MVGTVNRDWTWDVTVVSPGDPAPDPDQQNVKVVLWDDDSSTAIVNQLTTTSGTITQQEITEDVYTLDGSGSPDATTDGKNPHVLAVLRYGLLPVALNINFTSARTDTFFTATDPNITETNSATVAAYSIDVDHVTDEIEVEANYNVSDVYDFTQYDAFNDPQKDFPDGVMKTVDGTNYEVFYDIDISTAVTLTGESSTLNMDTGKVVNVFGTGNLTNATVNGNVNWNDTTTITGLNVNGTLDFGTAGTYTVNNSDIDTVTNSSGGNVTLNLSNSSVTTNTGPNITIIDTVTLTLTGIETDSEVRIINEDDVENFNKELTGIEQVLGSVQSVSIANGGTGYAVSDTLTVQGGTGTAATLTVDSVSGGVITGVSINAAGSYSSNPPTPASVTGGTGNDDATFNLGISGSFAYAYDSTFNPTVAIVVFSLDFIEVRIVQPLAAVSQTIPIQQRIDRTFSNP